MMDIPGIAFQVGIYLSLNKISSHRGNHLFYFYLFLIVVKIFLAQLGVLHQKLTPASLQLLKYEPVGISDHFDICRLRKSCREANTLLIAGLYFSLLIIHEWWSITYLPILLLKLLAILILIINGYLNCSTAYVGEFKICLHAHHKF